MLQRCSQSSKLVQIILLNYLPPMKGQPLWAGLWHTGSETLAPYNVLGTESEKISYTGGVQQREWSSCCGNYYVH